ncbi:unnamed protein product [Lepeophtheirus salmonis]|uniref:(salmon louse) hypothetical protein n=1 Tax=Lepeophtheirus salmonis TaxID=72036 RepID=A0A7R8CN49_LEPSM|nr:unnamed protein product [Lepeophtheirus salmonis]CAF2872232.1 unnamed protein product [Lepeophtheirus salmonis]
MNQLIPKLYEEDRAAVKSEILMAESVRLTSDLWTSKVNNHTYISLTAHYILTNRQESIPIIKQNCISCSSFMECHTSVKFKNFIETTIFELGIREKVLSVATDNAANMKNAISSSEFNLQHIGCYSHSQGLSYRTFIWNNSFEETRIQASYSDRRLANAENELNIFCIENPLDKSTDPLLWWHMNKMKYPLQSGYPGQPKEDNVVLHKLPLKDGNLLRKWVRVIPRQNYEPKKCSRLCSKHFTKQNYKLESVASNPNRKIRSPLTWRFLKAGSIPSIFSIIIGFESDLRRQILTKYTYFLKSLSDL